jgi:hypothetical protein
VTIVSQGPQSRLAKLTGMTTGWNFSLHAGEGVDVPAAPRFDKYEEFFNEAIPQIAAADLRAEPPVLVLAQVEDLAAPGRQLVAGPMDRAKALMDCLHDQRRKGPKYADLNVPPPLPDDDSRYVAGLAVEVRSATRKQVHLRLGQGLEVKGSLVYSLDVDVEAPNDVWADARGKEKISLGRVEFAKAVANSFLQVPPFIPEPTSLVIRHPATRDEDNTWRTWVGALGGASWSHEAWGRQPPLKLWRPFSIASLVDRDLPCSVRYELWLSPPAAR